MNNKKICIVGKGGFAREVLLIAKAIFDKKKINFTEHIVFLVKDEEFNNQEIMGVPQIKDSDFDSSLYDVVVAIGDPNMRKKIVDKLPSDTVFANLIHPLSDVSDDLIIGHGVIICSGVVITCNVKIGNHVHLNLNTTVGHDAILEDFVTTAPAVNISGSCTVKKNVYIGTGAIFREGLTIIDNSVIGMGAVVVKNINEIGVYVGNPAKKIRK